MSSRSATRRDDAGQTTLFIIGLAVVLLMAIGVVVDASAAYLRRQTLNALADSAALAATDGLQGDDVYRHGLGRRGDIDPVAADRFVHDYLARSGAQRAYRGLRVSVTTHADVVVVRLRAPMALPLHVPGVGLTTTVTGEAAAEVVIDIWPILPARSNVPLPDIGIVWPAAPTSPLIVIAMPPFCAPVTSAAWATGSSAFLADDAALLAESPAPQPDAANAVAAHAAPMVRIRAGRGDMPRNLPTGAALQRAASRIAWCPCRCAGGRSTTAS